MWHSPKKKSEGLRNRVQPDKRREPKMRGRKLRGGVYWEGVLRQKVVKQLGNDVRDTY